MKNHIISAAVGAISSLVLLGATHISSSARTEIDLEKPGDALIIRLQGKPVGGLRVDDHGRLGIFGANHSSTAVTIDGRDRVQIDPNPADTPYARLTVADDSWMTGVLRVGRADAFGDAPFDPNGAIQVGRNLQKAQPMALFRAYAQGKESFRLGVTEEGHGYWSDGPNDRPMLTFYPSAERSPQTGRLVFYGTELLSKEGSLHGRNRATGKETTVVPQ